MADAWHHRSDAISSLAAFVGILLSQIGGARFQSADAWAALVSCVVIAWSGFLVSRELFDQFMDASVPRETLEKVRQFAREVEGVKGIEKCRIRKSGLNLTMDIHVLVDGEISVRAGHDIAHRVKDQLIGSEYKITDVTVHIEPVD
jgi:cation diffusion facilitator family transporter